MKDVAVIAYCRTGIAKAARGALNQTHGIPLAAHVLRQVVERARIDPSEVEDVVLGCGLPQGATGHNIGRTAAIEAGFDVGVPGMTVNRYCGSGLTAASIVANRIAAGEASVAIAGGVESISLVQPTMYIDGFVYEPLQQRVPGLWWTMIQTADFVAAKYGISREAQDTYVVESQRRVAAATAAGKYAAEIVPFKTAMKVMDKVTKESHAQEVTLDHDEGPRADTTLAGLAALNPVYPGGTVTPGNASQLSDGAAAVVMMDADLAARRGLRNTVGDHERQRRRCCARAPLRDVGHPLSRLDVARARPARGPSRHRRRVYRAGHGDRRLSRGVAAGRGHRAGIQAFPG